MVKILELFVNMIFWGTITHQRINFQVTFRQRMRYFSVQWINIIKVVEIMTQRYQSYTNIDNATFEQKNNNCKPECEYSCVFNVEKSVFRALFVFFLYFREKQLEKFGENNSFYVFQSFVSVLDSLRYWEKQSIKNIFLFYLPNTHLLFFEDCTRVKFLAILDNAINVILSTVKNRKTRLDILKWIFFFF